MSMGFSMIFHDFPICSMNRWDNSMGFSAPVAQDLQLLHHHEPRLRGPRRAAGQLEGALSDGGDDGAGLRHLAAAGCGVGMVGI